MRGVLKLASANQELLVLDCTKLYVVHETIDNQCRCCSVLTLHGQCLLYWHYSKVVVIHTDLTTSQIPANCLVAFLDYCHDSHFLITSVPIQALPVVKKNLFTLQSCGSYYLYYQGNIFIEISCYMARTSTYIFYIFIHLLCNLVIIQKLLLICCQANYLYITCPLSWRLISHGCPFKI